MKTSGPRPRAVGLAQLTARRTARTSDRWGGGGGDVAAAVAVNGALILDALNTEPCSDRGRVGHILLIAAVVNSRVERAQRGLGVVSYGGEA